MDADGIDRTSDADADGEVVWFWHPKAGAKFAPMRIKHRAGDGDNKAWFTGKSTKETVKPLRGECRLIRLNLW